MLRFLIAFVSPPFGYQLSQCDSFTAFKISHDLDIRVLIKKLHQKFPASSAGHAVSSAVRDFGNVIIRLMAVYPLLKYILRSATLPA